MPTGDMNVSLPSDISKWKNKHAQAWLAHTMELPQYVDGFKKASIDGSLLVHHMTESHMEEMIGERLKKERKKERTKKEDRWIDRQIARKKERRKDGWME